MSDQMRCKHLPTGMEGTSCYACNHLRAAAPFPPSAGERRADGEADAPRDPGQYASFVQDGIRIYYSPRLDHASDMLELDSPRGLFQSKPSLVGPDELLARLIMGRVEAQNLTL